MIDDRVPKLAEGLRLMLGRRRCEGVSIAGGRITSITIHFLLPIIDFVNRIFIFCRFAVWQRAEVIARIAVVAVDAVILREESIFAHVFVDGLNFAIFGLAWGRLFGTCRNKNVVVRLILAFNDGGVYGRRRRTD